MVGKCSHASFPPRTHVWDFTDTPLFYPLWNALRGRAKTLAAVLELLSRGLDSASAPDAIPAQALELAHSLLSMSTAPVEPSKGSGESSASSASHVPRALLEEIVEKVAAGPIKNGKASAGGPEVKRLEGLLERVLTKAPEWRKRVVAKASPAEEGRGPSGDKKGAHGSGDRPGSSAKGAASTKVSKRKRSDLGGDGGGKAKGVDSGKKKARG